MSKFLEIYNLIMEELISEGLPSPNENAIEYLPKSKSIGLKNFKFSIHSESRDFERLVSYTLGLNKTYELTDKLCYEILTHRKFQISKLNRFCGLTKYDNEYFKLIIAFDNSITANLVTLISISKQKYEKLIHEDGYTSDNGEIYNFIIKI